MVIKSPSFTHLVVTGRLFSDTVSTDEAIYYSWLQKRYWIRVIHLDTPTKILRCPRFSVCFTSCSVWLCVAVVANLHVQSVASVVLC
jgi:hypothetical protein